MISRGAFLPVHIDVRRWDLGKRGLAVTLQISESHPRSRAARPAGSRSVSVAVYTNAERLWANTKKAGSSPEPLEEPLFVQQHRETPRVPREAQGGETCRGRGRGGAQRQAHAAVVRTP